MSIFVQDCCGRFGRKQEGYLVVFALILCGTLSLPMLPIWQGSLHVLAGLVLIASLSTIARLLVGIPLILLLLIVAGFLSFSFYEHPFSHIKHFLIDVYGHPFGVVPGAALLFFDLICMVGLTYLVIKQAYRTNAFLFVFVLSCFAFWFCSLLAPINAMLSDGEPDKLAQMMTGSSQWATWAYMAILPMFLVRDKSDIHFLLRGASLGAILIAVVVVAQWVTSDYSYVLDASSFDDYFYRVRGTYFYHSPAVFGIALGCMFLIASLREERNIDIWKYAGVLFLVCVVSLNNTRGVSLALVGAAIILTIGAVRYKKIPLLVVSLIAGLVMASSIFYVKPLSGVTYADPVKEQAVVVEPAGNKIGKSENTTVFNSNNVLEAENTDIDEVIDANSYRATLFFTGLKYLPSVMWTGAGIGTLELPLEGGIFGGLSSTYSAHTIYLDIPLMAGTPAFLFFVILFCVAGLRSVRYVFVDRGSDHAYRVIGLLGALVVFAVASLFFSQERNNLVGIGFFIASLLLIYPKGDVVRKPGFLKKTRFGYAAIVLSVVGWSVFTSPTYVFPALEFVARHGKEVASSGAPVGVTDVALKPIVSFFLRLRGVNNPDVFVLRDEPEDLPQNQAWILWSPANDSNYPKLRKSMGYEMFRQGMQAPSIILPKQWWVMPSVQPVVMFLYAGPRPVLTIPLDTLVNYVCTPDLEDVIRSGNKVDLYTRVNETEAIGWNASRLKDIDRPRCIDVVPGVGGGINRFINNYEGERELFVSGVQLDNETSSVYVATLPNHARWSEAQASAGVIGAISRVADLNFGSGVRWYSDQTIDVLFQMAPNSDLQIGVYRMVGLNQQSPNVNARYSWDVMGSDDNENWSLLDQKRFEILSDDKSSPSAYLLPNSKSFKYYSFRFFPSENNDELSSGIMELELYPLP